MTSNKYMVSTHIDQNGNSGKGTLRLEATTPANCHGLLSVNVERSSAVSWGDCRAIGKDGWRFHSVMSSPGRVLMEFIGGESRACVELGTGHTAACNSEDLSVLVP